MATNGCATCDDERRCACSENYITMPAVRTFEGGAQVDYNIPLKPPRGGHLMEKKWNEQREHDEHHQRIRFIEENQAEIAMKANFVNSTTDRCQMAQLKRQVESSIQKAEADLETKRNRLKGVINGEQDLLIHEYSEMIQNLPMKIFEQKKKYAEEIVKRQNEEKFGEAKEKLEQLERNNSEELRDKISLAKKLEAAEIQQHQICEKKIQYQREEEFDKFWKQMQEKRDEERLRYEEEEEQLRLTRIKEQREVLNKQIIGKRMMQDEMKKVVVKEAAFIDRLRNELKKEEEEERKFYITKKNELMKSQQAELAESMRLRTERQAHDREFENYLLRKLNEAIIKEKNSQVDTKAEKTREANFFRQQLKEIRAVQAEEEKQIEELRMQEVQKKDDAIRKKQQILKDVQDKIHRETLETWKEQLLLKKKEMEAAKESEKLFVQQSRDIFDINADLDQMFDENKKGIAVERIKDLEWQQKYEELLKDRQEEDERLIRKKEAEEEEKRKARIQSFGTCFGPPHPITKVIHDKL